MHERAEVESEEEREHARVPQQVGVAVVVRRCLGEDGRIDHQRDHPDRKLRIGAAAEEGDGTCEDDLEYLGECGGARDGKRRFKLIQTVGKPCAKIAHSPGFQASAAHAV